MDKKENFPVEPEDEKVLDFEQAKDLTVGEAVKKHQEIQAGVTDDDGVLDRYIKQHRQEIEAEKFETQAIEAVSEDSEDIEAISEEVLQEESLASEAQDLPPQEEGPEEAAVEETVVVAQALAATDPAPLAPELVLPLDEAGMEEESAASETKKKILFWSGLASLFVAILAASMVWLNASNQKTSTSSSSSSSSSQSSSSSSADATVTAFNQLYATFFTDSSMSKLKNSEFGKLAELKALLDKMDSSSDAYKEAKSKYDNLEKAIQAIQALNAQFDKDVIVDGEVDTSASVKSGETLSAVATGIAGVDATIAAAVNFGVSQQTVGSSSPTSEVASEADATSTAASETTSSTLDTATSSTVAGAESSYGIAVPAGVTLQRSVSRVAYNQTAIDDSTNSAWVFADGVLENIISISQQRGYISGNNYIIEKVNIINGNGYYNLFKPDGTYLFTINCKTGYFVGNGSGYSDNLDF